MNKEKTSNAISVLLGVFIILTIILGGYILYDKVLNKNVSSSNTNNQAVKKIDDVKGQYTIKFTNLKTSSEIKDVQLKLVLYDNGIFTYSFTQMASSGILGNYFIRDDSIVLTNWFATGSDVSLLATKGTKVLKINDDGTISDANVLVDVLVDNGINSAKLTKDNTNISSYNISNSLGAACLNQTTDGGCIKIVDPAI